MRCVTSSCLHRPGAPMCSLLHIGPKKKLYETINTCLLPGSFLRLAAMALPAEFSIPVETYKLKNGLRVILSK